MRYWLRAAALGVAILAAAPASLHGYPLPSPNSIRAQADALDLLYLGKERPYWFRMQLRIDGKPFGRLWEDYLDSQFLFLDRNRDGKLDETECDRMLNTVTIRQILLTGYPNIQNTTPVPVRLLDTDLSGSVSRAEVSAYYQSSGMLRLLVQGLYDPDPYGQVVSKIIFTLLDRNADLKLTKSEVAAAEKWLDALDYDEDEYISIAEIAPGIFNGGIPARVTRSTIETPLYQLGCAQEPIKQQAQKLLDRYDRDKDFHLTNAEIRLHAEAFRKLDRDGTNKLDIPELADWFHYGEPDVALKMTVAPPSQAASAELISFRSQVVSARQAGSGRVLVQLGNQYFEFGLKYAPGNPTLATQRDLYRRNLYQFFDQSRGANDFVDGRSPAIMRNPFVKSMVFYADRNRDDKLTRQEFDQFLDVLYSLSGTGIGLSLYPQSQNWFGILDENGDARLSRVELRRSWSLLKIRLGFSGSEIEKSETPGDLQFVLHQGHRMYVNYTGRNYLNPPPLTPPGRGPAWFRKMDRNGDGSISRREFLGGKSDFDRLDRDRDGLIRTDEAEPLKRK